MKSQAQTYKFAATRRWWCFMLGAWCFSGAWNLEFGASLHAQSGFVGTASNFTMSEYHDPPNETRMKSLINGFEARPQPGGRYLIKQLHLELFNESGVRQMTIEAPECIYDVAQRTASSAGRVQATTGDGQFYIEGEGFLWRQDAGAVNISNNVHSIIHPVEKQTKKQ